jgi:uncharacterized phage protein (TIGR01671 family)
MREILFRGKTIKGEWVKGVPFFEEERCYIIEELFICDEYDCTGAVNSMVLPETVGQYTGLTDKNGKKIFEGDIVNIEYLETTVKNAVIEYVGASFYGTTEFDAWELDDYCGLEVIGNIHDNPVLMEEKV